MPVYTAWPLTTDIDAELANAGITLRSTVTTAQKQAEIDAVAAEVGTRTQRKWIADSIDATRYYDGTGTAELEVDELVSFTAAVAVGYQGDPGYSLSDVILVSELERPATRLLIGRGAIPGFSASGLAYYPTQRVFPAGRQNIAVTGKFGYATAIPQDLWLAACREAAARLARPILFTPADAPAAGMRLESWREKDRGENYHLTGTATGAEGADPTVSLRWHDEFEAVLRRYRRPPGRRFRRIRSQMV